MVLQKDRILHFKSPLGDERCAITALSGRERLNDLYAFDVTLVADKDPISPDELLGESVTITLEHADIERKVHGVVCELTEIDPLGDNTFAYLAWVVPPLWLLGLSSHYRLFEEMTAVDIVKGVVGDGCGMTVKTASLKSYSRREICCQFAETDLEFVTRLLAEEGIAFYFEHTDSRVNLVLCGGMPGFQSTLPASYPYNERDTSAWKQRVSRFRQAGRLCTGKLVSTDYSEYSPSDPVKEEEKSKVDPGRLRPGEIALHGQHDFEGGGDSRCLPHGRVREQLRSWMAGAEADGAEFTAQGGAPSFIAGYKIELDDPPVSSGGETQFLLTEVIHNATEGYDEDASYANSFRCVATSNSMAFTPKPPPERRRAQGPQTAIVIEVKADRKDAHAEVKVQFPWSTEQNSCWARVVQLYAGNDWGAYFVPDIGQEVLVDYINGDPDRPVVVGAVYNDNHAIPKDYTKWHSGIKTRSDDYNELRFDDNPGREEVYFEAGKDHNFLVKNDEKGEIKNDQTLTVGNDQNVKVGDKGNFLGNQTVTVGNKIVVDAGTEIKMTAGMKITLKVGGSTLTLDNKGVTIEGAMITIKGNAMTEVSAGGILTLKGALTKIN